MGVYTESQVLSFLCKEVKGLFTWGASLNKLEIKLLIRGYDTVVLRNILTKKI